MNHNSSGTKLPAVLMLFVATHGTEKKARLLKNVNKAIKITFIKSQFLSI